VADYTISGRPAQAAITAAGDTLLQPRNALFLYQLTPGALHDLVLVPRHILRQWLNLVRAQDLLGPCPRPRRRYVRW
jgi:hypothetical protein